MGHHLQTLLAGLIIGGVAANLLARAFAFGRKRAQADWRRQAGNRFGTATLQPAPVKSRSRIPGAGTLNDLECPARLRASKTHASHGVPGIDEGR